MDATSGDGGTTEEDAGVETTEGAGVDVEEEEARKEGLGLVSRSFEEGPLLRGWESDVPRMFGRDFANFAIRFMCLGRGR